ncbi:MAG: DUF262 domain-containing protein [Zoogloeaceae bacterium]|jgi:hypothetical protein|nr:DUF262 domain-containing protein [Zoogloeaceae bacterium]
MAKTLEVYDKLIREIFAGSYPIEIPDYQRPYAWTTGQAAELLQEIRPEGGRTPTLLTGRQKRLVGVLEQHGASLLHQATRPQTRWRDEEDR